MAKNQSKNKNKLIETLILLFAVVAMGMLVVQIGINTLDTIERTSSGSDSEPIVTTTAPAMTLTPAAPTPTYDYSDVELNDSN
jgi:hypothetical protein